MTTDAVTTKASPPLDLEPPARVLSLELERTLYALGAQATEAARAVRLGAAVDYVGICTRLGDLARLSAQAGAQLALLDELRYGKLPPPPYVPGPVLPRERAERR